MSGIPKVPEKNELEPVIKWYGTILFIVHSKCVNYVTLIESCVTLVSINETTFRRI